MVRTDIHADDYALTLQTSQDMLSCMQKGQLDSISIVPNMSCFEACMELLYAAVPKLPFLPLMSVHLDFVEGRCLAGASSVPLLAADGGRSGQEGLIGLSWGGVFVLSYLPWKRREAKEQLRKEIRAQIGAAWTAMKRAMAVAEEHGVACKQKGLRIDSHQHAHMIPVVWEALTEVLAGEDYQVEYIRNSKEMMAAFAGQVSLWKTYRPINFVKNRLLSCYSHKVDRYCKKHGLEQMYLWGLIMSGHMDYDRIVTLYPKIAHKAQKDGRVLEILFHPGRMLPEEVTEEIGREAAEDFYLRPDRHVEMEAVNRIRIFIENVSSRAVRSRGCS